MADSNKIRYLSLDKEVPAHDYWDQTLLDDLLKDLPEHDRQVIVIPGARQADLVDDISMEIAQYPKVLVVVTSDEENNFPIEKLYHPDMITYVMYASFPKHQRVNRLLPIGYPKIGKPAQEHKKLPWFFAGQINHPEREGLANVLRSLSGGKLLETQGFSQGYPREEYLRWMNYASVVPCPGGPFSPDSFRLYETLELGGIPIPNHPEFWQLLFGEVPFPTLKTWESLPDLINNLKDRPEVNNRCSAWWQRTKRQLRYNLEDDLGCARDDITVLVPTSPIEAHPNTEIIEETIKSIRERLPSSEIIIMIDGVREEQSGKTHNYTEYTRRLLWKCNFEWGNVYPLLFETHQHQANMTREALTHVRTPTILFVEHDTPLTGDIPFPQMVGAMAGGEVNLIRFHYEAAVHPEHKHLMLDEVPLEINGVPLLRCAQWSQRPHLASTDFYRSIIDRYFPPSGCTMIEDRIYGELENAWFTRGVAGWNDFRVWMYAPEGDIKRSLNLDGRGSEPKYSMRFA